MKIVFMGTPEFAVASLEALLAAGFNVAAVVTAPDRPSGRGLKISQSAVKQCAIENQLPVLQPLKLKDPDFIRALKEIGADVHVVVAFRMLPEIVWNMPPMGTINLHGSWLPEYRGAAPINWAIINGEQETGITTFRLRHEIDTGNVLLRERIPIGDDETAGELHDRMKISGAALLVKTLKALNENTIKDIPQSELEATDQSRDKHAPRIFTDTCKIDWTKSADEIYNLIRGLSPYPAAFTDFQGKTLKIFKARKEVANPITEPGSFESDGKSFLKFSCSDGYIVCNEIQLEGKKKLTTEDFLRGYRFT